jgi:hypothetical protein
MKRHTVVAICFFLVFSQLQAAEESTTARKEQCELVPLMLQLFHKAALGKDPNQNERAAWVIRDAHGTLQLIHWPESNLRNQQQWHGRIPSGMISMMHVHNVKVNPRPSFNDKETARRLRVNIYTLHVSGVFQVKPDGAVIRVLGPFWFDNPEECMEP